MLSALLVDDEALIRMSVADALRAGGHDVTVAKDGAEALAAIASRVFDLVICDIRLPKIGGLEVFRRLREQAPDTEVILITAFGSVADAVAAMKQGAFDYLTKPFDTKELVIAVDRILERKRLRAELRQARAALAAKAPDEVLIGRAPAMVHLQDRIDAVAGSEAPVLISGESGTGKELVASTIHHLSPRKNGPCVIVNCAAFPETLIEAELFGHERGAFTGAVAKRAGRFKSADGGTLVLDEIAELPLAVQAKLLRVLQDGTFQPIGTNSSVSVDVRVISATNRNLKECVEQGLFRADLYYRVNVLDIQIPPLRERRGDLPMLVQHFLQRFHRGDGEPSGISPGAWALLSRYQFPGNVRELLHAIEHALVFSRGREIDIDHLPPDIRGSAEALPESARGFRPLAIAVREFEHQYLLAALRASGGKKAHAAELLGVSRKHLWERLRHHDIGDPDPDVSEAAAAPNSRPTRP